MAAGAGDSKAVHVALTTCIPEVKDVVAPQVWKNHIKQVLFSEAAIKAKTAELAKAISKEYSGKEVLCVGLLKGAVVFLTDLVRQLEVPYQIDFLTVSSYGHSTTSSGSVKLKKDLDIDPKGRHVLIIEDLIDTGTTLAWIKHHLASKECASVKLCTLLDKSSRRTAALKDMKIDFCGWTCPDEFVVGYGMDFSENYRCLPFVGVLKPEVYAKN